MQALFSRDVIAHTMRRARPRTNVATANGCPKPISRIPASRQSHRRAAWTLIEMLVTIAVMATLTGIAIKTLTSLMLSERRGVEHVSQLATMARIARTFRNDIHLATGAEISSDDPQKPLLQLTLDANHQIQYEIQPLGLLRTERRSNQSVGRELWRLKPARFQCVDSTGPPRQLTLIVGTSEPLSGGKTATPLLKELRIDAVVGRDLERPSQ